MCHPFGSLMIKVKTSDSWIVQGKNTRAHNGENQGVCLITGYHCEYEFLIVNLAQNRSLTMMLHAPLMELHAPLMELHAPLMVLHAPLMARHAPLMALHALFMALHAPLMALHASYPAASSSQ